MPAPIFEPQMAERRARDVELLDALDAHRGVVFEGSVWRIVRQGRLQDKDRELVLVR